MLVAGDGHAWVLIGWRRNDAGDVVFIACDDQVGPYEEISDPFAHYRSPWHSIMVPLPPKVFLPAEAAESDAHLTLRGIWSASEQTKLLADALAAGDIQLRTRLKSVRKLKREIEAQTGSDEVLRAIRMTQLPNFVWVVEAHDKVACHKSDCVVATVLYDSTLSDHAPRRALIAIPGAVAVYRPEPNASAAVPAGLDPWKSLLPAH